MRSNAFNYQLLGLLAVVSLTARAAESVGNSKEGFGSSLLKAAPTIRSWTTAHGLPQNWIECILQTRDGYLWVATRAGLARFDGVQFKVFDQAATGLSQIQLCKSLAEDRDGNLWIGTKKGLIRYKEGEFTIYNKSSGLCVDEVTRLQVADDGSVWVGTDSGLNRVREGKIESFIPETLARKHVYALHVDRTGRLWIGLSAGLYRLDPASGAFIPVWQAERPWPMENFGWVNAIHEDRQGKIWFGTNQGLYAPVDNGFRRIEGSAEIATGLIQTISETSEGRFWVICENEIFERAGDRLHSLGLAAHWPSEFLRCLHEDREGNIWLGTAFNGLQRLQSQSVTTLATRDGLPHDDVWSISRGRDDTVWIGTSSGLGRYRNGKFEIPNLDAEVAKLSLRSVMEDKAGNLWLGQAFGGVLCYKKTTNGFTRAAAIEAPGYTFAEDRSGAVWAGGPGGYAQYLAGETMVRLSNGVFMACTHADQRFFSSGRIARYLMVAGHSDYWTLENGVWDRSREDVRQVFPASDAAQHDEEGWTQSIPHGELSSYDIRVLFKDRSGALWFGTAGGGLNCLQDGRIRALRRADGLAGDSVRAIHEDNDGVLWIGTTTGLSRFKNGRFFNFTAQSGLYDNVINNILEDEAANFWIGCPRGIYRVSRRELNDVADGKTATIRYLVLDESDGMLSSEINGGCQPSACKTRDGKLWFATNRGVAIVDPSRIKANELPPPTLVEQLRANDEIVFSNSRVRPGPEPPDRELRLKPGQGRALEIQYAANSFAAPEKVRFKYRLDGHDETWRDAGIRRAAYYTNLKPGRYRFQVTACNNHNVWNETGASLAFEIAPYIFERWSFKAACAVALTAGLLSLFQWRLSKERRIQGLEKQFALAEERERIARDMHDEIGSHLTLVTKQCEAIQHRQTHSAQTDLEPVIRLAREAEQKLDAIVWTAQPKHDHLDSLIDYTSECAVEFLAPTGIRLRLDLPDEIPSWPVPSTQRYQILLAVKEALNNVVKHAGASQVTIRLRLRERSFAIAVEDDGCGFDPDSPGSKRGNGICNMRQRLESIGGELRLENNSGTGTIVHIQMQS